MTALERLRAAVSAMTDAPWRWDGLNLQSPSGLYTILRINGFEAAGDTHGIVALRNAAPALLDLWEACEREVDAVCQGWVSRGGKVKDGLCVGENHIEICPVELARQDRLAVLNKLRGMP